VVLAAAIAVLARVTLLRWLRRLSAGELESVYDDIVVDNLKRRAIVWTVLGTVLCSSRRCRGDRARSPSGQDIVAAALIMSVTLALVGLVSRLALAHAYGLSAGAGVGGTTLVRYISTTVLLFIGAVSVLALFGISVVPMITALGIGGLAVALAFQDTLANVFAGLNLTLARQIRVGDYIELDASSRASSSTSAGARPRCAR
jgi:small-conductance mechanosensitive channel